MGRQIGDEDGFLDPQARPLHGLGHPTTAAMVVNVISNHPMHGSDLRPKEDRNPPWLAERPVI
jgi:hypothetical protein